VPSVNLIYDEKHRLTETEWADWFQPIPSHSDNEAGWAFGDDCPNALYDAFGQDLEAIEAFTPSRVWSLASMDATGEIFILAGELDDWTTRCRGHIKPCGSFSLMGYFATKKVRRVRTVAIQLAPAGDFFTGSFTSGGE